MDDEMSRYFLVQEYLDSTNLNDLSIESIQIISSDKSDIIRAELADFIIVNKPDIGPLVETWAVREDSRIVYPKLWVGLAFLDKSALERILVDIDYDMIDDFEKCYFDAARYVISYSGLNLFRLCALAFSSNVPASYTSIDLLAIIAGDREALHRELVHDLEKQGADNLAKARSVFEIENNDSAP